MTDFLNHKTYEEMKIMIGAEATLALAERFGGSVIYFPKIEQDGHARGPQLANGLRQPEVRSLICRMRRDGATGIEIVAAIKTNWPTDTDKWVSKSALSRFLVRVRKGHMKEFGIDDMFREMR